MDLAPFRARRILFSWTAYWLGLGRPAWIVNVYALQNVACWLALGLLLTRWLPLSSGREFALWGACLFSHGLMWSVRFSLLDGPSLLMIALAVAAAERGRPLLSAAIAGISALGRETNALALLAQPLPQDRRAWLHTAVRCGVAAVPLLLWYDYLRSIYRSTTLAGTNQLVWPGAGIGVTWHRIVEGMSHRVAMGDALLLCVLLSMIVQAGYLFVRRRYTSPWWRVAVAYAILMLLLDQVLANPMTAALTRVLLPMTAGFNLLLVREAQPARFWAWFVAGNLHVLPGVMVMPLKWW